jgi:hypothetical protein
MGQNYNYRRIYFSDGEKTFFLPVNPPEIKTNLPSNNEKQEISKIGEITIQKTPRLKEVSFSSFFPYLPRHHEKQYDGTQKLVYYPYQNEAVNKQSKDMFQSDYLAFFEKARKNKTPILFKVLNTNYINKMFDEANSTFVNNEVWSWNSEEMECPRWTVEDFEFSEAGGDPDLSYSIRLVEWKNYGSKKFSSNLQISIDSSGNTLVEPSKPNRLANLVSSVKNVAKIASNVAKTALRAGQLAQKTVNSIKSAGNYIKSVT